ncbi:MAG: polyamine aminopropyltransferase [Gammaproteobacteria bacterium]|nr:polyamine aminopropyltransferase [Gammaproteobacteria bacterium]
MRQHGMHALLLLSTLIIAVCGLVYELLAGTVSSYLLGDSVYQFSIVIGIFMAALGLGSYLSRYVEAHIEAWFVWIQILIGAAGGISALLLFYAFSVLDNYAVFLFLIVGLIGTLVGMEIPLVVRLLRSHRELKLNISDVLTADYAGALFASLLFPLVLVPQLGLVQTGAVFGLLNLSVAGLALYALRASLQRPWAALGGILVVALALLVVLTQADRSVRFFEARLFAGDIIHAQTSPYQRIVVTRDAGSVSLFLNGALQFNTLDEYRYHESLVHPAMSSALRRQTVLILGGGDGLALREVFKYPDVEQVTLVDLDPAVTGLFTRNELLAGLNEGSLRDPRVRIVNQDAFKFLEEVRHRFDVIIVDLPDPHDIQISRLYSRSFYGALAAHLAVDGVLVTQATSPMFAREAFWCVARTLESAPVERSMPVPFKIRPYHVYVPSFGEWGFVMASARHLDWPTLREGLELRYLSLPILAGMADFAPDIGPLEVEVNTIDTHVLARYYEQGWKRWY